MSVLVTGGAGFIGSVVVDQLSAKKVDKDNVKASFVLRLVEFL